MKHMIALAALLAVGGAIAGSTWKSVGETRPRAQTDSSSAWMPSTTLNSSNPQPPLLPYIPTYHRDVQPILERNCTGCHSEGNIGPFRLDTPEDAIKHARAAQLAVQSKRMPPWMPGGASPAFKDAMTLTPEEIAVIANWSWAGAPLGKASDAKTTPVQRTPRSPDRTVDIGRDFQPDRTLSDEYRCFLLDPKLESPRYVTGYDIAPGNRKLVHHVVIFQATGKLLEEARSVEAKADGRGGWTCFGGPGIGEEALAQAAASVQTDSDVIMQGEDTLGYVGSWVPGVGAVSYPDGTGILVKPGAKLIMQVHYNLLGGEGSDRTAAKLFFAPANETRKPISLIGLAAPVEIPCAGPYPLDPRNVCRREAAYQAVRAYQAEWLTRLLEGGLFTTYCNQPVPNGSSDASRIVTRCDFPVTTDRLALGTQGHMHTLGANITLELNPQDAAQRKVLLEIPRWDFHWQTSYWFQEPVQLRKGDTLRITCTFDNTPGKQPWIAGKQRQPRYVVWGESTQDEMCVGNLQTVKL